MLNEYVALPYTVRAGEVVFVVDFDPYEFLARVKLRGGGRVYEVEAFIDPEVGDYVMVLDTVASTHLPGFVCGRVIQKDEFEKKFKSV